MDLKSVDLKSVGQGLLNTGINAVTGGLGSAITSGLGSLFGGLFGSSGPSQKDLMKWQEKMLQRQFDFQSQQAELNRKFQSQQSLDARTFSAEQAQIARDWNAIGSQMKRADAAGVNPFALVGSGNYGSAAGATPASAVGIPSGSMPSGASVPQPAPNTRLQEAQAFSATAAALSNLAEARRTGVDTTYMERALNDLVRKARADADNSELINNYQTIVNKWQDKLSSKQYSKLNHEIDVLISTDWKNLKDLDEANARIDKLKAEFKLTSAQWEELRRFLDVWFDKERKSIIDLRAAQAGAAGAAAVRDVALAGQAGQMTENLKQQHELVSLDLAVRRASNKAEQTAAVNKFTEAAKQYGVITGQMEEALKKAARDNNWYVYDKIIQGISAVAGAYGNIAGGTGSLARYGYIPYGSY